MTSRKTRDSTPASGSSSGNAATDAPAAVVFDFEKALADLEGIVERLEHGELPLEDSLQEFERGITLTRQCQAALRQAEQKVEILMRRTGQPEPFEPDDGPAGRATD